MGIMTFFGAYGEAKAGDAVSAATRFIAKIDPAGVSQAQLVEMERDLDGVGRQVAELQSQFDVEKQQLDEATTQNATRIRAAEVLQGRLDSATDEAEKASLGKSLDTLLALTEPVQDRIESLKASAEAIEQDLCEFREIYKERAAALKGARDALAAAQREMELAERERERAERHAEMARTAAGLRSSGDSLNIALDAMRANAEKSRQTAAVHDLKAAVLRPADDEHNDQNIADAMAQVADNGAGALSAAERLAALKARAAGTVHAK